MEEKTEKTLFSTIYLYQSPNMIDMLLCTRENGFNHKAFLVLNN